MTEPTADVRRPSSLARLLLRRFGLALLTLLLVSMLVFATLKIPVTELLASKLPVTVELAVASMLIALVIGIPAGVVSAARKGTAVDVDPRPGLGA